MNTVMTPAPLFLGLSGSPPWLAFAGMIRGE